MKERRGKNRRIVDWEILFGKPTPPKYSLPMREVGNKRERSFIGKGERKMVENKE